MALGGNLGTVEGTLRWALRRLQLSVGPLIPSSLYRTRPLGGPLQPDYLNAAAAGWTRLPADAVLAIAKELERASGRTPGPRNAPRPLDVDLLLYGEALSPFPELTLPHPRLRGRRFVLQPLADVAPDRRVPPRGWTVRQLLAEVAEQEGVEEIRWSDPPPPIAPPEAPEAP